MNGLLRVARTPGVRSKVAITVGLLLLYRVGTHIPAPGVSYAQLRACATGTSSTGLFALVNLLSGGAMAQLALFAIGVMPYITASIIIQLLTHVVPRLDTLRKEGPNGTAAITQYTRYLTVGLSALQAGGLVYAARGYPSKLFPACMGKVVPDDSLLTAATLVVALVAGTVAAMWIGEVITERGIGNGMSLLMMASIAAALPSQVTALTRTHSWPVLLACAAAVVLLVAAVAFIEQAQRRIPVVYSAKATAPAGATAGTGSYLPLKVNQPGVVPVIFASSLLSMPSIIAQFTGPDSGFGQFVTRYLARGDHPVYVVSYVALIVFFTFFYLATAYNPAETADDLRAAGGFVPGYRPGEPTAAHLDHVMTRLSTAGAVYLSAVAVLPLLLLAASGGVSQLPLGGTSLLILVGVGLETVKALDAQLLQRSYPGFLPR